MFPIDVAHRPTESSEHDAAAHASPQTSVAFSPSGEFYASGGYDGRVVMWERAGHRRLWTAHHDRLVNGLRFSPSGKLLASVSADKTCRLWDSATGALVQVLARQPDDLNSLAWVDDTTLVTVSQDGTGRIWNTSTGHLDERVLFHSDHCMSVDASPDGTLATCGEDAVIRIWGSDGRLRRALQQVGHAEMCRWSPSGDRLAVSCDDGYVHLLTPEGELLAKLGPYTAAVKSVAWSPDGSSVAVGAYDSTVSLWATESGQRLIRWYGSQLWPRSLDFSSDGTALISGTISTRPAFLDLPAALEDEPFDSRRTVEATSPTYGVNHLSVGGGLLAAGCDDSVVRLWRDLDEPAQEFSVGNGSLVNTVALPATAAPEVVAYGTFSGQIGVLGLGDGRPLAIIQREHPVNRVSWSPSGDQLAVADYEGTLDLYDWDGATLNEASAFRGHHGAIKDVVWLTDNRLATVSTDRTSCVVTREGHTERVLTGHGELINDGSVTTIGGRTVLATVSRDRTARLYDVDTGELLTVLVGHDESVKAVAWQPGGEPVLLTGSYDFTGRLWRLDPQTWQVKRVERLEGHGNAVSSVGWVGDTPLTGSWDARVHAWPQGATPDAPRRPRLVRTALAIGEGNQL